MLLSVSAVLVTAVCAARIAARGSAVRGVLAGFLTGYAEIVALGLLLSVGDRLTVRWMEGATVGIALVAVVGHHLAAPAPTGIGSAARTMLALLRADRLLLALTILTGAFLAYDLALTLLTPPAEGDAIGYHLARAAYWVQFHGVGVVPGNTDPHIDGTLPGAELVVAFTMLLTHSLRFAGLVQFVSLLAACVGIFGIARRLALDRSHALYGALLFPTASIVLLQAPTALNDIVVAAFVVIATYFLLGETRLELGLGGLAVACLAITKITVAIAIPGVLLAVVAIRGLRRSVAQAVIVAACTLPTLLWAALGPKTHGSRSVGGVDTELSQSPVPRQIAFFGRLWRMTSEALELPGGAHRDMLVYAAAALVTGLVLAAARPAGRRARVLVPLAVAATMLFAPFAGFTWRVHRKFWDLVGVDRLELLDVSRPLGRTDTAYTWYGPVAVVLVVAATIVLVRKRSTRRLAVVAAAPLIWMAALALIMRFAPTSGRYVMGAVGLSAATWGVVLSRRAVAMWAVPVAGATALLAIVHFGERPLGIRLFEETQLQSVWTRPYDEGIGFQRGAPEILRFTDRMVPTDARLGLSNEVLSTPFFGRGLTRTILPVDTLAEADRAGVDWAILLKTATCRTGWRLVVVFREDFAAFRRSPGARC